MRDGVNVRELTPLLSECDPGLKMLEFNVLVLPEDVEKKTAGGIILIDETADADKHAKNQGLLVALSPAAFSYDDMIMQDFRPNPGDKVLYAKYGGTLVKGRDGREYRVLKDKDIAAVVEPTNIVKLEAVA